MVKLLPQCLIMGSIFVPSKVHWSNPTKLRDVNERGDIGKMGRYKGLPLPYESCTIVASDEPGEWDNLNKVLELLEKDIDAIRKNGGEEITVYCNIFFQSNAISNFLITIWSAY